MHIDKSLTLNCFGFIKTIISLGLPDKCWLVIVVLRYFNDVYAGRFAERAYFRRISARKILQQTGITVTEARGDKERRN